MKNPFKTSDLILSLCILVVFLLLSIWPSSIFESIERVIYGTEMRVNLPRTLGENRIAIVAIDEKSVKHLGPWPWPRSYLAEMVRILKSNGAKLIGIDLLFGQKEQVPGLTKIRKLETQIKATLKKGPQGANSSTNKWILDRLRKIEADLDTDKKLCDAIKRCDNVIMPVLGKFGQYKSELISSPLFPFVAENALTPSQVSRNSLPTISVDRLITPYPELAASCAGLGHINQSPDPTLRGHGHLPVIDFRGHLIPSMPMALGIRYLGRPQQGARIFSSQIELANMVLPAYKSHVFVKFKGSRGSFPNYSFMDILRVKKIPAVFEGKIVLIGLVGLEGERPCWTPVDPSMPHVELMANVIDAVLLGRYVARPKSVFYIELLLMFLIGIGASYVLPRLNYFPRTVLTAGVLLSLFLIALTFFIGLNIWFKITYVGLSLITIYIGLSVKELIITEKSIEVTSKESIETNRMLGLSLQSQGLLDLAFEKFRKCPLDDAMKDVLYNLGLDFERKRMMNKAVSVYEYILKEGGEYRDLHHRIPKLRKLAEELPLGIRKDKRDTRIPLADDLETKPTVGRYEILEELGQGAMGMVYKAKDPKINRLVAVKTIRFSDEFEEDRLEEVKSRFYREAELAGKLAHPSIVAIYDVGEDYDLTYIAMEFLEGEDLEAFCQKDTLLPIRKVIDIVADTAEALDYAHRQGIIHRDVKPANIMLLKNGRIKVTDFGIAKATSSSQTKSGVILGTPNYMSPEQINGQPMDGRSDIFSLGVVFFQLLTGELPFKGKTLTQLFYNITQAKHPSPRSINPKVMKPCEQIIDKALAKDPNQRFQSAGDFAKYLRRLGKMIDEIRARRMGITPNSSSHTP
ncbi:MAG: hypothetical protein DRG63_08295 [Deltaproteobacteria bacterium]|nr:MAG: hypothetical protein DRG63_08295 [Deltaproteobacteria bacterium]